MTNFKIPLENATQNARGNSNKFNQANDDGAPKPKFSLKQFSVKGKSKVMREKMQHDVFVLDGIALLGQLTVIYAKPNTGKTLLTLAMLKDSIEAGRIKGENIFYINADDSYKGAIQKLELAEKYGFEMILPDSKESEVEFKVSEFNGYLQQLIDDDAAHGVVVVLDTLKSFTDLMDKKQGSKFMKLARAFSMAGGTMIMLAHTNKNRNADGKVVAGGTSDISDDACCAYTLDEVKSGGSELIRTSKDVLFENFKSRGNVERELLVNYSVIPTDSYFDKLESVKVASNADIEQAKKERNTATQAEDDAEAIKAFVDGINQGNHKKADLLKFVTGIEWKISHRKAKSVLERYAGTKLSDSSFWRLQIGDKNSQIYYLLKPENESPEEYENAKNG